MKTKLLILAVLLTLTTRLTHAQGTLVFDQESSSDEAFPIGGVAIQFYGTVGQSFIPSLSSVGFVRLKLFDLSSGNALGATAVVNLRANAINGTILSTTSPVTMADGFRGSINFYFANAASVTPGLTYFMEVAVQSGDTWGASTLGDAYAGGTFYGGGGPATGNDLWFREGIVVPEPSAMALLLGSALVGLMTRKRRTEKEEVISVAGAEARTFTERVKRPRKSPTHLLRHVRARQSVHLES